MTDTIEKAPGRTRTQVIRDFQVLSYQEGQKGNTWAQTTWCGISTAKNPTDMFVYAELIWELRPHLIIETGTWAGGSALFYAQFLDNIGIGRVVTVDIGKDNKWRAPHPRLAYVVGRSSVDEVALEEVQRWVDHVPDGAPILVSLDSDHSKDHVLAEMDAYAKWVTPGSYMVVEDTEVNAHPVYPDHGPGPHEAVEEWLPAHPEFREDTSKPAKYLFSSHKWLRKVRT